jgi:EAL domain-containing protein (putative c-di-GMP-specific phosphodiesterase class I)
MEMMHQAQEHKSVEQGLRNALKNKELVLHYQPKIHLKTGRITGAEALVRWRRSGREMVPPSDFVRIAEESGLIVPMGRWILHEACERAAAWHGAGGRSISVSVNLSSLELQQPEFIANVKSTLVETSLPASCLQFELTEGVLMHDIEGVNAILKELQGMGIHIAVDDFGTGYSSLSYLHQFPVDILKIDQTFVQQITERSGDSALVSTIIAMGKTLHCLVVAEGVETEEQRLYLVSQGCDEAQGFLFSRPVTGPEFLTLLTHG